jgi:hypothetical protein
MVKNNTMCDISILFSMGNVVLKSWGKYWSELKSFNNNWQVSYYWNLWLFAFAVITKEKDIYLSKNNFKNWHEFYKQDRNKIYKNARIVR